MSMEYTSSVWKESREWPGVRFQVLRMSLRLRQQLTRELGTLAAEGAFHRAGDDAASELAAEDAQARIDEVVIRAALLGIEGLNIDGAPATVDGLLARGPASLAREIADAIAGESSLSETERKN